MDVQTANNDYDQLVFRLERNHRCVLRMVRKLNSYQFEPKSPQGFDKIKEIKQGFNQLAKDQLLLFNNLQKQLLDPETAYEQVKLSLKKFNLMEQKVAAYILGDM